MTLTIEKKLIKKKEELSPRIRRLRGIIKVEGELDYKEILKEDLIKK